MKMPMPSVTDYFGTRLEPRGLRAGLKAAGLGRFALILRDDEAILRLPARLTQDESAQRALTWLRSQMSPLLPCRIEPASRAQLPDLDGSLVDRRRRPLWIVALAEIWNEEKDSAGAAAGLLARLGCAGQARGAAVHFISWRRPGEEQGVRPALILAASLAPEALTWLEAALADAAWTEPPQDILLDGLEWAVARRPTIAAAPTRRGVPPVLADPARCRRCGLCAAVCPTRCLGTGGRFAPARERRCLGCFDCVEACPQDALRPRYGASSATLSRALRHRSGWLSRLRGDPGPPLPAPFPPSYLLPRPETRGGPRRVLGLSITTMQEHAAALLEDGAIAGAAEEERLARVRHYGFQPKGRPGVTIAADPTLCLEEVLCRRAIGALLAPRRLTLDDMDLIAVNGIPARYRRAYSQTDPGQPIPVLRSGRVVYLSHHLCHAASAWRMSGQETSWVLTVDGRGDRETAAVFRASRGRLRPVCEVLSLSDRSIGGVYETLTRLLGFGAHGQGSVMALASLGSPAFDLARFLSLRSRAEHSIHETGLAERFAALARLPGAPLTRRHRDLAASLQAALEATILALLKDCGVPRGTAGLCLAGGVALNCRMNALIRARLRPSAMFVQPGANDGGTALGAALEAAAGFGKVRPSAMSHAYLGPEFTPGQAEAALKHAGLPYRRAGSVARAAAALLARGEVVCWCQGRMEFGPRALGGRSILADPRRPEMHDRVNRIKEREPWRPFGPSILAGHERDWFEGGFDSRFMLFTLPLKADKARLVPAVAHVDATSRPQSVHRAAAPLYHELISRFHALTGVPMVLNTSFNRRGEPIVCTPEDAVDCFLGMPDCDALALGPFIARRPQARRPAHAPSQDSALVAWPGGRRLMLRLNVRCDCDCAHCTIRDLAHLQERSFPEALRALAEGRRARCSELVVMRGEPGLWPALPRLLRRARRMGYRFIQLQTSGRGASRELARLADAFEITLLSARERRHDELARRPGAFRQALMGARAAAAAGRQVLLCVPVLRSNREELHRIPALAVRLGAARVQFCFPRPVETVAGVEAEPLARLADVSPHVRAALRAASRLGLPAATEAIPWCHLDPEQRTGPDSGEDWRRFRVDDLDRLSESLDQARPEARPEAPACRNCRQRRRCPRTWALYLALFGSAELAPIA